MANLGFTFNTDEAPDRQNPIEPGTYVANVIEADVQPNQKGTGTTLKLTWSITEGPSQGRRIWQNINIQHTNPDAQRIGQAELKEITASLGLASITSTDPLLYKPLVVTVANETSKQDGKTRTVIKKVAPYGSTPATRPATAPAPAQAAPSDGSFGQPRQAAGGQAGGARGGTPWGKKNAAA